LEAFSSPLFFTFQFIPFPFHQRTFHSENLRRRKEEEKEGFNERERKNFYVN